MIDVIHMALPMDGRVWRVEWLGEVRRNPFSPRELEVRVAFRRMKVRPAEGTGTSVQTVHIGVGALCRLAPGTLWKDGRFVGEDRAERLSCHVELNPAAKNADAIEYPIFSAGRKHRAESFGGLQIPADMSGGHVMRIKLGRRSGRAREILIPLFEIARSWFLRDTELTLRLLSAPIESAVSALYDPYRSIVQADRTVLAVKPGLSEGTIPVLAMLARDEYARSMAGRMVNRIVRAHLTDSKTGVEALPPLRDRWRIEALGAWGEKKDRDRFYVHRMVAVQLPPLGDIEWFPLDEDAEPGSVGGSSDPADSARERSERRSLLRVIHHSDPSARRGRPKTTVDAAPFIDPPRVTRREREKAVEGASRDPPRKAVETVDTEEEAATGAPTSYGEGLLGFGYESPASDGSSSKSFLAAGLKPMLAILRLLEKQDVRQFGGRVEIVRSDLPNVGGAVVGFAGLARLFGHIDRKTRRSGESHEGEK
ncbi:hypothetical protein DFR24_3291 [Panacagrimonas perspica]|uniref:Uncharacterized protein n=1 Tax=Panacagrimonas perspica TaxID=381431 RepID=A0A4R7P6J6_9GAMM|nr:hypothetical protein [Panacagrimonas perspica]TDU28911.1 hypothetical protein DFR24_3291 [Panacagrimonas perspica]THD02265.1 hypothetical protein B1810_15160 [Panacagrimonas perspica]